VTELAILVAVPFRRAANLFRRPADFPWARASFLALVGLVMLGTVFGLFRVAFHYFAHQAVIGPFLVNRMFSLAFMTFLFMLVYSNFMTSLSSHFLSRDLPSLFAAPVAPVNIYIAKSLEAVVGSSWMVLTACIPLYLAYGMVRHAPPSFYLMAAAVTVPFLLIPAAFSSAAIMLMMHFFPARRLREVMLILGALMFVGAAMAFRLMEPERLVNPKNEMQVFEFMKMLQAPSAPYLPSAWASRAVLASVNIEADPLAFWYNLALLWAVAVAAWTACLGVARRFYLRAWQSAAESMGVKRGTRLAASLLPAASGPYQALLLKDVKTFIREPAQWGQVLLLGALVFLYLFNISRIPKESYYYYGELKGLLFFLNTGFIGLILTAVAARFLFPLVSLEGRSFELLRLAPISMRRYLWTRWAAGTVPLMVLSMGLVGFSVPMLGVDRFATVVAVVTMAGMTLAVAALAVGCGAAFAKFRISNPEEIVTSAGGFAYMAFSALYIVAVLVLEAQPVRVHYWAGFAGVTIPHSLFTGLMLGAVVLLTAGCVFGAILLGSRSLQRREL